MAAAARTSPGESDQQRRRNVERQAAQAGGCQGASNLPSEQRRDLAEPRRARIYILGGVPSASEVVQVRRSAWIGSRMRQIPGVIVDELEQRSPGSFGLRRGATCGRDQVPRVELERIAAGTAQPIFT